MELFRDRGEVDAGDGGVVEFGEGALEEECGQGGGRQRHQGGGDPAGDELGEEDEDRQRPRSDQEFPSAPGGVGLAYVTVLIFGFGVIVAVVVEFMILNQTLSTQITRQLPQYATLKAMGYADSCVTRRHRDYARDGLSTVSYVPAVALSILIYSIVGGITGCRSR